MVELVIALLALMWIAACVGKLDAWTTWHETAGRVVSHRRAKSALAIGVPITEMALVTLLFASPRVGLVASGVMLTAMAGGVGWLTRSHAGAACGCFGAMTSSTISWRLAAFDAGAGLAALAIAGLVPAVGRPSLPLLLFLLVGAAVVWVLIEARRVRLPLPTRPKVGA